MPTIFPTLKTRKSRRRRHAHETLKRTSSVTATPLPSNPTSSNTSSDSSSRYSQGSGGKGRTADGTEMVSPPSIDLFNMKPRGSGDDVLTVSEELCPALSENPPTRLIRKASKVGFTEIRFGGMSMLGGHGRKSQQHGVDDEERIERLSEMKRQVSTVDGRGEDKEVGNGAPLVPTHGIMKTATNVSVGAGTHSVRFTLDLPPKLDLDLSLSVEKVEDGSLDKKDGTDGTKEPSRWGQRTTEAVLDRSKIVSTEFVSREDNGGGNWNGKDGNEGLKDSNHGDEDDVLLKDPNDEAVSTFESVLDDQQNVQRDYSGTSSISTLQCEPSFTIYSLEDLAAGLELTRSVGRGHVSSGQERVIPHNRTPVSDSEIEEVARESAPTMNSSRITRKGSKGKAHQSNGCVSA